VTVADSLTHASAGRSGVPIGAPAGSTGNQKGRPRTRIAIWLARRTISPMALTRRGPRTFAVIGGKGRYTGAKGDGTWEAHGTPIVGANSDTNSISYVDTVANIKK
jgi:hypothetical protein